MFIPLPYHDWREKQKGTSCCNLWLCLSYDEARRYVPPQESDYTHYAFTVAEDDFAASCARGSDHGIQAR
jgi:hypothetical protein